MHDISGERVDWNGIPHDFPILHEPAHGHQLNYFDNVATSQKPRLVIDALRNYYDDNNANVRLPREDWALCDFQIRFGTDRPRDGMPGGSAGHALARAGPQSRAPVVSFTMKGVHPHDLTTFADKYGLALHGGHHCNQPLMRKFWLPGTARANFYFYNTLAEVDGMIDILRAATRFFA